MLHVHQCEIYVLRRLVDVVCERFANSGTCSVKDHFGWMTRPYQGFVYNASDSSTGGCQIIVVI